MNIKEIIEAGRQLLTPAEVETIYGIPVTTQAVWRCVGRYNFPYLKVGSRVRYRREAIEAWLKSREHSGNEVAA